MKECIVCKKEINKRRTYCSQKCYNIGRTKKYPVPCEYCGKIQICYRRFCSHSCYSKSLIGKPNNSCTKFKKGDKKSEKWMNLMTGRVPWNKGIEFTQMLGEKHPNWKGGASNLFKRIRQLPIYKEWRTKCYERDNYCCVYCGKRGTIGDRITLNCHHIESFKKIIKEEKINSTRDARKCNKLWDINNGRTLCLDCHKKTDGYGIYNK